jgi:hypothetical protein
LNPGKAQGKDKSEPDRPEDGPDPVPRDERADRLEIETGGQLSMLGNLDGSRNRPECCGEEEPREGEGAKGTVPASKGDDHGAGEFCAHEGSDQQRDPGRVGGVVIREVAGTDFGKLGIGDQLHEPDHGSHPGCCGELDEQEKLKTPTRFHWLPGGSHTEGYGCPVRRKRKSSVSRLLRSAYWFAMERKEVLARIQDVEDAIIDRFCSVKRRLERKMAWVDETTDYTELEDPIRQEILFYEARGYYLFQEPWLDHEPFNHRYRVVLTFRPTESNR